MKISKKTVSALSSIIILVVGLGMMNGCGEISSPTAPGPTPEGNGLWNPQPGFQIEPGQEVPLLNPGYWDSENGPMIDPSGSSRRIGILGGTLTLGYHSYTILPGAVLQPTTFTLAYASENAVGIDCGPSPFQFLLPVILRISYRDTQYDDGPGGFDPSTLHIYLAVGDGIFIQLPSLVNLDSRTVTAVTDHFSRYILG